MKRVMTAMVMFCAGTFAMMGQPPPGAQGQSSAANTSRSNVKNNTPVFSQGPGGKVQCTVAGTACTKAHLDQVTASLTAMNAAADQTAKGSTSKKEPSKQATASVQSTSKSNVKTNGVVLGPDGSLLCGTTDGKTQPCTAEHVGALNSAAAEMPGSNDPITKVGVGLGTKKPN